MGLLTFTSTTSLGTITAAKNTMVLTNPASSGKCGRLIYVSFANATTITATQLQWGIYYATDAGTGTPTSVTPTNMTVGSTAASAFTTVHTYATTEPTLAAVPLWQAVKTSATGWEWFANNRTAIFIPETKIVVLRLVTASVTSSTIVTTAVWEENDSGSPFPPIFGY